MTLTAKITAKSQITVPHQIRRALHLRAGDRLVFKEDGGEITVAAMHTESPFARYRGIGNPGMVSGRRAIVKRLREFQGD